jgi:hypothetical protein
MTPIRPVPDPRGPDHEAPGSRLHGHLDAGRAGPGRAVLGRPAGGRRSRSGYHPVRLDAERHPQALAGGQDRLDAAGRGALGRRHLGPGDVVVRPEQRRAAQSVRSRPVRHHGPRPGGLLGVRDGPGDRGRRPAAPDAAGDGRHARRVHRGAHRDRALPAPTSPPAATGRSRASRPASSSPSRPPSSRSPQRCCSAATRSPAGTRRICQALRSALHHCRRARRGSRSAARRTGASRTSSRR